MNLLLGISGGIAAYKVPELIRLLVSNGVQVKVVPSKNALNFVTEATLQTVSNNDVYINLFGKESCIDHIELAKWADIVLVVPTTANLIAKCANGICDDLLSTILVATNAPIILAPAMNKVMWQNYATQTNISILKSRKIDIIDPDYGIQACGDIGYGRMPTIEDILSKVLTFKKNNNLFKDIRILITAGSTREMIDPVRFIGNKSSGKMAFALANEALNMGAKVTVIKGITSVLPPDGCNIINVTSCLDMLNAVKKNVTGYDIFIACAAVTDYRVANYSNVKIKKNLQGDLMLNLIPNPDILAYVANNYNIFTVGFAAETENIITNAKNKLINKKIKLIIANDVSDSSIGFESDYNEVYAISDDKEIKIERNTKIEIAQQILSIVYDNYSHTYN